MKRFVFLVIFCSLVAPCYAQFRPNVPKLTGIVSRQAAHAQIGYAGRLTTPGMIHTVPRVSVAGYFHLLGSGKIAEPVIHFPEPEVPQKIVPSPIRPLESLQLEATALGLDERHLATYSRQDLSKFINSYHAMKNTQEVSSRFESDAKGLNYEWEMRKWAQAQPEFIKENYVFPTLEFDYKEPFYPVEKMNILVVRDENSGYEELVHAAKNHPGVTVRVDRAASVPEALELLATNSYDVVLVDFTLPEKRNGFEVAMHIWNKKLNIPVICYSVEGWNPVLLLNYNMVGQIPVAYENEEGEGVLSYLSNMIATGKAYPD